MVSLERETFYREHDLRPERSIFHSARQASFHALFLPSFSSSLSATGMRWNCTVHDSDSVRACSVPWATWSAPRGAVSVYLLPVSSVRPADSQLCPAMLPSFCCLVATPWLRICHSRTKRGYRLVSPVQMMLTGTMLLIVGH
jgi:hypothetical protein